MRKHNIMTKRKTQSVSEQRCVLWPDRIPRNDWSGKKIGKLKYLQPVGWARTPTGGEWFYLVECSCGNETITRARWSTKSCGCGKTNGAAIARLKEQVKGTPRVMTKKSRDPGPCFQRGYVCDLWEKDKDRRECIGDRCYVNERLDIGIF